LHVLWPYNPWDKGTRQEPDGVVPRGYNAFLGANAFTGHGAVEIDMQPVWNLTEAECTARCDADSSCDCVAYGTSYHDGGCWKRRSCEPSRFQYNTEFIVFMKKTKAYGGNAVFSGKNCFGGMGCDDIDSNPAFNVSVEQCFARCDDDPLCECVVYAEAARNCWKRANCDPGAFQDDANFVVYLNSSRTMRPGRNDADTFSKLLQQIGGDGFNGDTMDFVPRIFWSSAKKQGYPLAFEPEHGGDDDSLNWDAMGWGYWPYPKIPPVDRFKFLTHGKFLTNLCNRWAKNKTDDVQFAWFNGDGYESWENVWGTWNGIVPRDGEAIRRVATMLRHFGEQGFLQSPLWEPHTLDVLQDGVYASRWPLPQKQAILWTIVNRGGRNLTGPQLRVDGADDAHYYDCYHGVELRANDAGELAFALEAGGYGCVLRTAVAASGALSIVLATMQDMTLRPLASYSAEWTCLKQTMVPIAAAPLASVAPLGTVHVPKGTFHFAVQGVEIEGDDQHCVDVQFPWEQEPIREHEHTMEVGPFYMDKYPVTCANYSRYLSETGFRPTDTYNWLKNWNGDFAKCPDDLADRPVTYVSLNEARRYCKWAGGRLPHSWEWQYAAQGTDGRRFPWGNDEDQSRFPVLNRGRKNPGPEPVTKYAGVGDSPFGVSDLVGNVWQYTDEFQDDHTRAVLLRGSSNYRPTDPSQVVEGGWYFPRALELGQHNKFFLMDDRYERAGTIGFRCLVDAAEIIYM